MSGTKKKGSKKGDDGLDNILQSYQPRKFTMPQAVSYMSLALFLSSLPVYLYLTVYDLSFEDFGLVYIPVTLISAFLLMLAYRNVCISTTASLSNSRRRSAKSIGGKTAEEIDAIQSENTLAEATAWSFFLNNGIFFALFFFL
jgi:hypothetical protein